MKPWQLMFGFHGAIGRLPFVASVIAAVVAFYLVIQASLSALPWMAEVLAPRGINAGLALNLIWLGRGLAAGLVADRAQREAPPRPSAARHGGRRPRCCRSRSWPFSTMRSSWSARPSCCRPP